VIHHHFSSQGISPYALKCELLGYKEIFPILLMQNLDRIWFFLFLA